MAADFDEHVSNGSRPPPQGVGEETVFTSDDSFDLDRVGGDDGPTLSDDPADEARLLGGAATFDLDNLEPPPPSPPKRTRERAPRRGADVARRAAASAKVAPPHRPRSPRRGLAAAIAGMAAAVTVVVFGLNSGLLTHSPPVDAPASVLAPIQASPTPEPPTIAAPPSAERAPVVATAAKAVRAPKPAIVAVAPLPEPANPATVAAIEPAPTADIEVAVAPPEPPVAPPPEDLADCRAETAADACWESRLADAERLLVAAHLNARLAGVPAPDLRVGLDDWIDASTAAEDRPQARLGLYSERIERVEAVAAAHAVEAQAPPELEAAPSASPAVEP